MCYVAEYADGFSSEEQKKRTHTIPMKPSVDIIRKDSAAVWMI